MPRDTAISRSVLSDQVKDRLLQAILAGSYPPGERIVETRVAREFGTSQAPVREALRDLEALGVVEIAAFRGARVRRPSSDELLEAFVVRNSLEALGVRLALPRVTAADIEELQGYLETMRRAADGLDVYEEVLADTRFHALIVACSGNVTLERVWQRLEPFSRTYITMTRPGADRRRIADLHAPILDALRVRDEDQAVAAVERHFSATRDMLGALWEVSGSQVAENPRRKPAGPRATRRRPVPAPEHALVNTRQ